MAGKRGVEILPLNSEDRSNSPNEDSSGSTGSIEEEAPLPPPSPMKPKSSNVMVFRRSNKTVYTAGRPPWYNSQGQLKEAFVIGLCGGSASGKTTVATKIIEALDVPWVSMLSLDSFYKVLSKDQHELANKNEYNFDHPENTTMSVLIRLFVLTVLISITHCATTRLKQSALQKRENTATSDRKNDLNHAKKAVNIPANRLEKKNTIAESNKKRKVPVKTKPVTVREFPLNDIFFKGALSNEANRFIRANTKKGKPLELVYEYTREQDLNDIEERIRRRFIEYSNMER